MPLLPSGLPEYIDDNEDVARFLTQSSHYSSNGVKPSAFLPRRHDRQISVSRHGRHPEARLWNLGEAAAGNRTLHGAAIFAARAARVEELGVQADEPPARHALIVNWPVVEHDPQLQKARRKEIAIQLARAAGLPVLRRRGPS